MDPAGPRQDLWEVRKGVRVYVWAISWWQWGTAGSQMEPGQWSKARLGDLLGPSFRAAGKRGRGQRRGVTPVGLRGKK